MVEGAVAFCLPPEGSRLAHLSSHSRRMLVQTLLFCPVVGIDRTWDLRGYTGDALGLLSGRLRAYGYHHTERLLSEVAHAQGQYLQLRVALIRDFLLPLGLDTNHGYGKKAVENSEVARKRAVMEKRLANVQRWAEGARKRCTNASKLYTKRCKLTKERATELYRVLNNHQIELEQQGMEYWLRRQTIKEEKAVAVAEIEEYQQRQWKAYETSNLEHRKCERYCQEQRELLRALEDLTANERAMYELDNRKDQVMTVFKVALANLVMWTRDRYFPASYACATWKRLAPFFHLSGKVMQGQDIVFVELRPFNDRQYNQDLAAFCEKVNTAVPRLPDGRCLHFSAQVSDVVRPILDTQKRRVA